MKTASIDIEAKYKVWVGTIFMGGSHPAANGGAWMTAVFGFGGVKADEKKITINPRLYKKWDALQFNLSYKSDRFRIKITPKEVEILADEANKKTHVFIVAGKSVECASGNICTIQYSFMDESEK
jgi:nigerose phosphorylase